MTNTTYTATHYRLEDGSDIMVTDTWQNAAGTMLIQYMNENGDMFTGFASEWETMEDILDREMEEELDRFVDADHPGETWMQACGNSRCTWGCGEAWVRNEAILG